jgi:hypothetical protein
MLSLVDDYGSESPSRFRVSVTMAKDMVTATTITSIPQYALIARF